MQSQNFLFFRHSLTAAKRLCILRRNISYQNKIYTFSCIHDYNQSTDLMYPINVPCKIQHVSYWYEVVSGAEIIDSQVKCLCKITFCQHLGFFDTRLCFYKRYLCLLYDDANIEWLQNLIWLLGYNPNNITFLFMLYEHVRVKFDIELICLIPI